MPCSKSKQGTSLDGAEGLVISLAESATEGEEADVSKVVTGEMVERLERVAIGFVEGVPVSKVEGSPEVEDDVPAVINT